MISCLVAGVAILAGGRALAAEPGFSDWARNPHAAARLVALGPSGGERQAAVEIRLDPGFLTYWRQPGEAGLPPTFDTSGSSNIAAAAVDYPAPRTFEEGGVPLFGYKGSVAFPLRLTLADASRPATLALHLSYAVCGTICLPGSADLSLPLPAASTAAAATLISAARATVPHPAALGGAGMPAIEAVTAEAGAEPPMLKVAARAAPSASLFVEGPDGWFFVAGAATAGPSGEISFPVSITDSPKGAQAADLRLTLVDPAGAIEVPVHVALVDVSSPKP